MNALPADDQDARDMAQLVEGRDAALNALMERHGEKLFHYLVRSLQDENDAADLAQETFVRLYQNRTKFDPSQKFTTWLYAIASNLVRDRFRWRSRHPQTSIDATNAESETALKESLPALDPAPDQHAQIQERAVAVQRAVATLPEDLRQPLILTLYQEMPQAEVAVILKCSVKAVETRIYRARQLLRERLADLMPARSA